MARWITIAGAVFGALVVTALASVAIGRWVWTRETARAIARLEAEEAAAANPVQGIGPESWDSLPPPVQRYLRFALGERPQRIRTATIEWSGEFQMRPGAGWVPFSADQRYTVDPPGFVWDARIRMLPLVAVRVRDGYRQGTGSMRARIAGVVPVVNQGGTSEIAQSALARWLGEAVWFPTALAPGGPVSWQPVDDATAIATVRDGEVQAVAEFHFAPTGEITRMSALRYRDVDGTPVLTPFEGRMGDYVRRDGVRVPVRAEVAWLLPGGRFPYWRGSPRRIEYRRVPLRGYSAPSGSSRSSWSADTTS